MHKTVGGIITTWLTMVILEEVLPYVRKKGYVSKPTTLRFGFGITYVNNKLFDSASLTFNAE